METYNTIVTSVRVAELKEAVKHCPYECVKLDDNRYGFMDNDNGDVRNYFCDTLGYACAQDEFDFDYLEEPEHVANPSENDIDYTDPKAINQAVLEKLYVIGQEIFDKYVQVNKEGGYTSLHLHKEKNALGEPIRVTFFENPEYTVQVGPFRCKFPANFVFKLINRFEKLNNMGNKKMKVFTYGENPAEIVSAPCVYLDAKKEFKTGNKKIKKITDSLALLRMAGGRFRLMYHISGTWYQVYDCINGGADYAEKLAIKSADRLSQNPDYYKEMVFAYECCGGAYDQIIVAMRAAYGDSETSQTLEQEEQEEENRIRERFPLEGVTVEENTTGPNGVIYFTVEGAGPVTEARVRADLKPGDTFNVYTKDERKYGVKYDGVSLNRSIWNELPDIVEYEEKYYPEDCPTDADGNRFYTDIREDYAPFPYVVLDRLDGSVWFFTDSEDEAKDWAADYNQEYSDGGKRKKQPDVEHEVIRTDMAKCAG